MQEESVVTLRFYVPQGEEEAEETPAFRLQQQILSRAGLTDNNGNMIAEIDSRLGKFMTPRGRYTMEFYDNYMHMSGNNYTYKILQVDMHDVHRRYKTISCVYMFEQMDPLHKALVFCLTKPLRQGQQTYPHLVLYVPTDRTSIELQLDEVWILYSLNLDAP